MLYIHTRVFGKSFLTSNCQLILRNEIIDMFKIENIIDSNGKSQWKKDYSFYENVREKLMNLKFSK